jgi:hypothetical protein
MNMNNKKFIWTVFVLVQWATLFSQRIDFTYDDNGNRSSRILSVEQLRSNSVEFPVSNQRTLKSANLNDISPLDYSLSESGESSEILKSSEQNVSSPEQIKSDDSEIATLVYPNPSKGVLKIDVSNMPLNSNNELRIYDLNGTELLVKRNFDNYSEIDISHLKNGIYILRIQINQKLFDWKVIKED